MDQLPEEVFTRICEVGIHLWGIGYLPPLCLTCKQWQFIITSTPRLWGILTIHRHTKEQTFIDQLIKAKAAPLSVTISGEMPSLRTFSRVSEPLMTLSPNCVYANIPSKVLTSTTWSEWRALETLVLPRFFVASDEDPEKFFGGFVSSNLRSFCISAVNGINTAWIRGFLSPHVLYFEFKLISGRSVIRRNPRSLNRNIHAGIPLVLEHLSLIPSAHTVRLDTIHNFPRYTIYRGPIVHLTNLTLLHLTDVSDFAVLLCNLRAPALQTLSVVCSSSYTTAPAGGFGMPWGLPTHDIPSLSHSLPARAFLAQWSQPDFLPSQLRTLELLNCLENDDIPFLVRWLAGLHNLVRLSLQCDGITMAQETSVADDVEGETNIFRALVSTKYAEDGSKNAWLCPSLMQLSMQFDAISVNDLLPIARERGGSVPTVEGAKLARPSRLRMLSAPLCPIGDTRGVEVLRDLVDEVVCSCLGCQFHMG